MLRFASLSLWLVLMPSVSHGLTAEEMEGEWESLNGGTNTCAANPARLKVTRRPDHLSFDWPVPFVVFDGSVRNRVDYDLLEERADALVLRLEGDTRLTEAGEPVIWLMRPSEARDTFCWGRTDWPVLRCEHVYRRCTDPAPIS